ncbi:hypothetical protein [Thiocapsa sp. UBA6158]|jgi:hypothetical protein|uniref:hypothetical protein n=1 Tax=Thiocapsa sp. UBA6158 TaxID=1947692 RepID=UPI0025F2E40E|nr:hypothetical protein [Thiocapsa sp. UBA6158]
MKDEEIIEHFQEEADKLEEKEKLEPLSEHRVVGNRSGYNYRGSENFEHDDTGSIHNFSGVEDEIESAYAEHEGWEEGYDY